MFLIPLGFSLSSVLLKRDIYLPIRPITENTVDALLNEFLKVSQSQDGGSILGEPFNFNVTTLNKKALPTRRRIQGRGFTRNQIENSSIVQIRNTEQRFCLFFALEAMRMYYEKDRKRFSEYVRNYHQQLKDARVLMRKANIPDNQLSYEAADWCQTVQNFYDKEYGRGVYGIFIFNELSKKPIYKSKDAVSCQKPIFLYYHDDHFDGIRNLASFFGKNYYCLSCESTFTNANTHRANCQQRCIKCGGLG